MRFVLIAILLFLVGCQVGTPGVRPDGTHTLGKFDKCEFDGHSYVIYSNGISDHRTQCMVHDPECRKCK